MSAGRSAGGGGSGGRGSRGGAAPPGPVPRRPYLLRAMHQWISDSGMTPHIVVAAHVPGVEVPRAQAHDGKIVLNVADAATHRLTLGNDWVEFGARFGGVAGQVRVPLRAVLGIYARETGEGIMFTEADLGGLGQGAEAAASPTGAAEAPAPPSGGAVASLAPTTNATNAGAPLSEGSAASGSEPEGGGPAAPAGGAAGGSSRGGGARRHLRVVK